MSTSDSFSFLLRQITKDLNDINDRLALVGLLYLSKKSIESIINLNRALRNYVVPCLISNEKWIKSLGNWAIIVGCLNQVGYGYARELAKKQINLILIDENPELLNKTSEILRSDFGVEVIAILVDFSNSNSYIPIEKSLIGKDVGILVNSNCFSVEWSHFHTSPKLLIEKSIDSIMTSFTLVIRMILPSMFQKNKGAIVSFSTSNTLFPSPYSSVTAASNVFTEKLMDSWRHEYSEKNIYFQTVNTCFMRKDLKFVNEISLSNDVAVYTHSAIKTLGWSNYSFGYWFNAFKFHTLIRNIPISIINFVYSKSLKRNFENSINQPSLKKLN